MSDLITEIHHACNGDQDSFEYLAGLTAEDWASQPHALGQFLQEPRHEAGWMDRFARLFAAVLEPHGREVLTDYLDPTSGSAFTAIKVVEKIGAPRALFAVPLLEVLAASEQVPLYLRNRAAQAAAQLQGRAPPPPLEGAPLPVTDEGLRRALASLPDDVALRREAYGAVAACAEALGEPALALLRDFMQEQIGAGSRPLELSPLLSRSAIARRALLELLPRPELRPGVCAAIEQAPDPLYEAPLEALLAACPEEAASIGRALEQVTGEFAVGLLDAKNETSRAYGRRCLAAVRPDRIARHGARIVEALNVVSGAFGWGKETDEILDALDAADEDALVENLVEALRPQRGWGKKVLQDIALHAPDASWTRRALAGLDGDAAEAR